MTSTKNLQAVLSDLKMNKAETPANILAAVAELQVVENVFAGIEQTHMIVAPINHGATDLEQKVARLSESLLKSVEDKLDLNQTEAIWRQELNLWRVSLAERDQEFSAFDLRSFCANAQPQFDKSIYSALAGFYRTISPTVSVLSKFDYVVTQLFSYQLENNRRELRYESERLVEEIKLLNFKWTGIETDYTLLKPQIAKSINALSKLCLQARAHKSLKSWIESEFFDFSREVKRGLTNTFFVPEVTTAIVISNLVTGNHFAFLCEADNALAGAAVIENLTAATEKTTNVISDPLNSSFQTLIHSGLEEDFPEAMAKERLLNLFSLIGDQEIKKDILDAELPLSDNIVDEHEDAVISEELTHYNEITENSQSSNNSESSLDLIDSPSPILDKSATDLSGELNKIDSKPLEPVKVGETDNDIESENQPTAIATDPTAQNAEGELSTILSDLSNSSSNHELVKSYLQKSVAKQIQELRFEDFLIVDQDLKNKNLRQALQLILRAESMMRHVVGSEGDLAPKLQDEIVVLNEQIQIAYNTLRRSMGEATSLKGDDKPRQKVFETLLYATNTLIETQLRLNSAITRRRSREENRLSTASQTSVQNNAPLDKIRIDDSVYKPSKKSSVVNYQPNKWLIIGASLIVLFGAVWFVFNSTIASTPVESANVKSIDPKILNGGTNLNKAKVSKNTLFGFVSNEWNAETRLQKENNLKLLLGEGRKYDYNKVFLINQQGELVGNASETGAKIF